MVVPSGGRASGDNVLQLGLLTQNPCPLCGLTPRSIPIFSDTFGS